MIPGGNFTAIPVVANFVPPYDLNYTPLSQIVPGGIAIGDPSQGRLYQNWEAFYDSGNIQVRTEFGPVVFTLPALNVETVSLAFDNNMGIVLAWETTGGANLYYFDTISTTYITRFFPGINSCRVCVDNSKDFYTTQSDVIFGYTLGGNLYYRQQRDRYDVEYLIGATTKSLIKMAPSEANRLQFELR